MVASSHKRVAAPRGDRVFYGFLYGLMAVLLVVTGYPMVYIFAASFSDRIVVMTGKVFLWPVKPGLEGYRAVLKNQDVLLGFRNTVLYTLVGTSLNVTLTMLAAYPFARKGWPMKKPLTFLYTFTMLFSGGMVPSYLLMRDLKLIDTAWTMILPGAISIYNMIIARTFVQNNIPEELFEASLLDGCDDFHYFAGVVLPLSQAILAVLALYYAVGHWNAYFNALIYLNSRSLYPMQVFLREILIMNQIDAETLIDEELMQAKQGMADLLKYALIVVSTAPILCVYPFLQRYFVKGVMIGSVKG